MEIVQERLERESNIDIVQTAPNVTYEVLDTEDNLLIINSPSEIPDPTQIVEFREPIVHLDIVTPDTHIGSIMKLAIDRRDDVALSLTMIDVWDGTLRQMSVADLRERSNCAACQRGERVWLSGQQGSQSIVLCGRNAVQIRPNEPAKLTLTESADRLRESGDVTVNPFLLRLKLSDPDYEITLFADGRAIIKGTDDPGVARAVYSRYVGL